MNINTFIQFLIYFHASLGGFALISGMIAIVVEKGSTKHKNAGKLFFYSMFLSAVTALLISVLPNHESAFLFSIGVFSVYFLITGYRALRFKTKTQGIKIDTLISWTMVITALFMIIYYPFVYHTINPVLTVFGGVGLFFSLKDILIIQNSESLKKRWLKLHLGKMMGGYISATTAFVVVNNLFPGLSGWFIPGIIGGLYIRFWSNKLNREIK